MRRFEELKTVLRKLVLLIRSESTEIVLHFRRSGSSAWSKFKMGAPDVVNDKRRKWLVYLLSCFSLVSELVCH